MRLIKKYLTQILILVICILAYLHLVRPNEVTPENPNKELLDKYEASKVKIDSLSSSISVKEEEQKQLDSDLSDKKREVERLKAKQYENVNVIAEYTPDELFKLCSSITRRSLRR